MNTDALRKIGLTENEIIIYLDLLKSGSSTAYEVGKRTDIYRVHVYDKVEQLMSKGLVTHIYKGAKKYFQATDPSKIKQYLEDKRRELEIQEQEVDTLMPKLVAMTNLPREDTFVEVFKGPEGLKYFLKDIIKTAKEVLITGINDEKYNSTIPIFMKQYFRDLRKHNIRERVITALRDNIFLFGKNLASTTEYRYLSETDFNPTNTFIFSDKVVIVTWGSPVTAVMIKNSAMAQTYRGHFEHLWKVASIRVD
tara:strand:- start:358 stop:1113 length:756 start_codon:yes stop_codon:yes gene_type:complete